MQFPSNRIIAVGEVSPWGRQFLQGLQAANILEVSYEASVANFCSSPSSGMDSHIIFIENQPECRTWILNIRKSDKPCYIIWFGRSFSKDDYKFSLENRIYAVFESLKTDDQRLLTTLAKLSEIHENEKHFKDLVRAVKGILVQTDEEQVSNQIIPELKSAIAKIERVGHSNEFLGGIGDNGQESDSRLPFHRTQDFPDALNTISDLERTGVLWIKGSLPGQEGRIEFIQGKIVSAASNDVHGLKAIWRIFLWDSPRFLFSRSETKDLSFDEDLNVSLKFIIDKGNEQKSKFEKLRKELPPLELKLELEPSMLHKGTLLPSEDFSALASAVECGVVSQVLDYNLLPDVDLYESLIRLRRSNLVRVSLEK